MQLRSASRRTAGNLLVLVCFLPVQGCSASRPSRWNPAFAPTRWRIWSTSRYCLGYNFPNADAALDYGYRICDEVSQRRTYAQVMSDVEADFATSDWYQASYLICQAVNELCPALIWQLRNSAAGYRPPPGITP